MRFVDHPPKVRGGIAGGVVYDGSRMVAKYRVFGTGYIARLEGASWIDARSDPERVALLNRRGVLSQTTDPLKFCRTRREAVREMKRIAQTGGLPLDA